MSAELSFASFRHPDAMAGNLRFDLASNGLLGLQVVLDKHLFLGDLGLGGFSYLQEVSSKESLNLGKLMAWKRENEPKLIGKSREAAFVFAGEPERGGIKAVGMIRNLEILLLLRPDEVEAEAKRFLSGSKQREMADQLASLDKLNLMIEKTAPELDKPKHNLAAQIGLNVSLHSLMGEVGGTDVERAQIFKDYSPKRTFIKFGLSFENREASEKALQFANPLGLQKKKEDAANATSGGTEREEPELWFDISET